MIKQKLYHFLIQPQYRIWRHLLLISTFVLLAFRRIFFIYLDSREQLGNGIYFLCIITAIVYVLTIYTNLYYLIPRFLLQKRYKVYLAGLFGVVLIPLVYQQAQEHIVRTLLNLPLKVSYYSGSYFILSNISSFTTMLICVVGTSIPLLFKKRTEENRRMSKIQQEHIKTELERLKKQISPVFLSNILRKSSLLVKNDPEKAADMLMRLGELLRYQLYDCNRNKVLLSAEINFIKGYLQLEQLYRISFAYDFTVHYVRDVFVPPLLFIPFVQYLTDQADDPNIHVFLQLDLLPDVNSLQFICQLRDCDMLPVSGLFAIEKRLGILYPGNYDLTIADNKITLQIDNISAYYE